MNTDCEAALAISSVACCLPERILDVRAWAARCRLPDTRAEALLRNGAMCFHDASGGSPVRLASAAVNMLLANSHAHAADIGLLVHAHTIQTSVVAAPYSSVCEIQRSTGLVRSLAFSVSQQNCVSPMASIGVVRALMQLDPSIQRAVVVCADVIGPGCDHIRAIGELAIHSDGACALLVERAACRNQIAGLCLYTDGRHFEGMDTRAQPIADEQYYWSAFSTMRSALAQARVAPDDVTRVLPHHVNLPGWYRLLRMLGIAQERLYIRNLSRTGHVFGADPFVNLRDCGALPGECSLLFSSGLAGCFGAVVIRH